MELEFNDDVGTLDRPEKGDPELGPLKLLPGVWRSSGRGWNMIALPFVAESSPLNYRLVVNQYDEELEFALVDKKVPNRGIGTTENGVIVETDQFLAALDYEQRIRQVAADDFPQSGQAGPPAVPIHHEPGLWLLVTNENIDGVDIARLATIPHGDAVLALGTSSEINGVPRIPVVNGLPDGVVQDLENRYLAPYKHFREQPFKGTVTAPEFPGFDPVGPHQLLALANQGVDIARTTVLAVDTTTSTGGIANVPFIVKQANATSMKSTFWIQELKEKDSNGDPKLRLQYLQVVLLDFFPRRDGLPGLVRWPHVSINTLEKDVVDSNTYFKR